MGRTALLRTGVSRGPNKAVVKGQGMFGAILPAVLGDPQIGKFVAAGAAAQYVGRFDIPVDHLMFFQFQQGFGDIRSDLEHF